MKSKKKKQMLKHKLKLKLNLMYKNQIIVIFMETLMNQEIENEAV